MRLDQIIWGITGLFVTIAIATKTNIIKNLVNKVKNPPHSGFYFADDDSGGGDPTADWPDWMKNLPPGMTTYPGSPGLPGGGGGGGGGGPPGSGLGGGGGGGGSGPGSGQGGSGGQPVGVPSRGSTRQSWGSGKNFPQGFYFYYDPLVDERYPSVINSQYLPNEPSEPNFTQPLVPPNINKEIESQEPTKKHHHHKKKKNQTHESEVYAQVECPSDPNSVPCGYNCYMNGQLMTVSCVQETPYNYNPYRSGGPSPKYPLQTGPSKSSSQQNSIHPTTPEQNLQDQFSQYHPGKPSYQQPSSSRAPPPTKEQLAGNAITYLNKPWDGPNGCRETAGRMSCRRQGTVPPQLNTQGYMLEANVVLGGPSGISKGHGSPTTEITSGGPGSNHGCCCGVTIGVKNDSGTVFAATEDWNAPGDHVYICDDSQHAEKDVPPCTQARQPVVGANKDGSLWNSSVHVIWQVAPGSDGDWYYSGSVNNTPVRPFKAYDQHGNKIYPGNNLGGGCNAKDPSRIRVDSAGNNVQFGPGLAVYPLGWVNTS